MAAVRDDKDDGNNPSLAVLAGCCTLIAEQSYGCQADAMRQTYSRNTTSEHPLTLSGCRPHLHKLLRKRHFRHSHQGRQQEWPLSEVTGMTEMTKIARSCHVSPDAVSVSHAGRSLPGNFLTPDLCQQQTRLPGRTDKKTGPL